ncbi:DnaJ C-terminal domain-containing protein [Telmatospirillum sp. J64-1]|uniref:DnaJ C-terminal domain-containing protein n=1 Tax=Telmatospirillum sp. J64-1 TaxID=2502183 RepID=UPI00115F5B73|nr:J domain-containing protein [Telmatospirillum sp. J64-1]
MEDPYKILGIAKTASQDEIKKAYRKLARELHPDLHPGDRKAEDRFKAASAAYDLLSDPDKRARFDRGEIDASGAERMRRGSWRSYGEGSGGAKYREGADYGFDPDDIFAEMMRRKEKGRQQWNFGFGGGESWETRAKGRDARYTLKVSFVDAAVGATKRISLPNGKTLDVRIPPGTHDKQTLRLKGQGSPGSGGGPAGDALVEITVEPHPFFERRDNDIHVEVPVTLQEAVMGGKITVPTVDGKVALTVPPHSNSGTVLRLRGKGIAGGDQFVRLKVMLPDPPDKELEAFLKRWQGNSGADLRRKAGME